MGQERQSKPLERFSEFITCNRDSSLSYPPALDEALHSYLCTLTYSSWFPCYPL
jgi:hypothetical protein